MLLLNGGPIRRALAPTTKEMLQSVSSPRTSCCSWQSLMPQGTFYAGQEAAACCLSEGHAENTTIEESVWFASSRRSTRNGAKAILWKLARTHVLLLHKQLAACTRMP